MVADILQDWANAVAWFWAGYAKQETEQALATALPKVADSSGQQDWLLL